MKYKEFKAAALGKRCRNCVNQQNGLQLRNQDCRYWLYPFYCENCGQLQSIVTGIEPASRWKIWRLKIADESQDS